MAIIKYGGVVAQATGRMGGMTLVQGKGAKVVRMRPHSTPAKRRGGTGYAHLISQVNTAWKSITASQRRDWEALALDAPRRNRLGEERNITGRQLFLSENLVRARAGVTLFTGVPRYRDTGIGALTALVFYEGGPYTIGYTPPIGGGGYLAGYLVVRGDRACSKSGFRAKAIKYVGAYRFTAADTIDCEPEWTAAMGAMVSDEIYAIELQYLPDNGLATVRAGDEFAVV